MDNYNNTNNFQQPVPTPLPTQNSEPIPKSSNGLSTASLVLGICALVLFCCGGGLVLGALGIIFAALSRGASQMNTQAKVGLGLSIGGGALSLIILMVYLPAILMSQEFQDQFNYEFNRRYDYYYDSHDNYDNYWDDGGIDNFQEFWNSDDFQYPDTTNETGDI